MESVLPERGRCVRLWIAVAVAALAGGCGSPSKKDLPPAYTGTAGSGAGGSGFGGVSGTGGSSGAGGGGNAGGVGGTGGTITTPDAGSAAPDANLPSDGGPAPDAAVIDGPASDVAAMADLGAGADGAGAETAPRDGAAGADGSTPLPGGTFLALVTRSAGMTMAMDATGTLHVAASTVVDAGGKYMVVYARCAGGCTQATSWSVVTLAEVSTGHVPTIALTQDGRPRIAYFVAVTAAPGLHYLGCDAGCTTASNWRDVRLTSHLSATPSPRPRLPFAVSPGGAAAFAYDDGAGLQLLHCPSDCGQLASWSQGKIAGSAGIFYVPESLLFTSEQGLQLVARLRMQDRESLLFYDCAAGCGAAANWAGVSDLWHGTGEIQAILARTAQGGARIAVYADDPTSPKNERVFGLLACDGQCRTPASWKVPLLPPIPPDAASVGYALALDGGGRPVLAYAGLSSSAVARCTSTDCTTSSSLWQITPGLATADLDAAYPVTVPAGCVSGSWSMYTGPALALSPAGKPMVALTAGSKAFGGQCGTGSSFIETSSYLSIPP